MRMITSSAPGRPSRLPSLLAQQPIQHPAAPHEVPRPAAVFQYIFVLAAGIFESVRENREAVESALVVNELHEFADCAIVPPQPGGGDGGGVKQVAGDVA